MGYRSLIAKRYLLTARTARLVTIITGISVIGIAIGVAALTVVLSVFNGFNGLVTSILVGFDPHIRIEAAGREGIPDYHEISLLLASDPRVAAFSPYVSGKGMAFTTTSRRVILTKGIDASKIGGVSGLKEKIVLGEMWGDSTSSSVVIGLALADRLGVVVGDSITVVSPQGAEMAALGLGQPILRRLRVTGIYESNNRDYDIYCAFVPLAVGERLFQTGYSGVEIRLTDIRESEAVKQTLERHLGPSAAVMTWYDLHRDLYSVMEIERWVAYIILLIIIFVASFNLVGSLTMSVIEKRRDIGALRAMGATGGDIVRIYLLEGLFVGLIGTAAGALLGYAIVWAQATFHLVPLDPTVYIISAIPVEVHPVDLIVVGIGAILISTGSALYPALRASRLMPAEAVRWE